MNNTISNRSICIIFDLDGTLVDSEHLGNRAFLQLLPRLEETEETLTQRYRGQKLAIILDDLENRMGHPLPANFEQQYRDHVKTLFAEELKAMPGTHEMLAELPYARCIASSGPISKIKQALAVTELASYFGDNLFSSYQINSWKPEPDLFLHAAKQMDFQPGDCIVVEDSEVGITAAQSAGMKVLAFDQYGDRHTSASYPTFTHMSDFSDKIIELTQL